MSTLVVSGHRQHLTYQPDARSVDACKSIAATVSASVSMGAYHCKPTRVLDLMRAAASYGLQPRFTARAVAVLRDAAQQLRDVISALDNYDLRPYQNDGVSFLWRKPEALLADDMGLGKTIQALCALLPEAPAIVVANPVIMLGVWEDECRKWRKDLAPVVCRKRGSFRWPKPGELIIIGYGVLPDSEELGNRPPESGTVLIGDEIQCVKAYRAQRTQHFRMLSARVRAGDGCVWGLTGTPVLNDPGELWGILEALGIGSKAYGSRHKFIAAFGGERDMWGVQWEPEKIRDNAMDPLAGYVLRRTKAQVLSDLPAETIRTVRVDAEWSHVASTAGERPRWMDEAIEELDSYKQGERGEMLLGSDLIVRTRRSLAEAKIPAMLQLLDWYAESGETVVVFSAHRAPIDFLEKTCGIPVLHGDVTVKRRNEILRDFQDGKHATLGATIQVAGTGITLTRATQSLFVDQMFTPGMNEQARARLVRFGLTHGVVHTIMEANDFFDRRCNEILAMKTETIERTTNKLKPETRLTNLSLADILDRVATKAECNV